MPAKDRHGKTAQDYRSALIAELDAVPDYHRRKPRHSPLLLIWLLVPVSFSTAQLLMGTALEVPRPPQQRRSLQSWNSKPSYLNRP